MILLGFVVIGAAAGLLAGGRLSGLARHGLRGLWLCILSFVVQGVFGWLPAEALAALGPLALWQPPVAALRYGLLVIFILLNRRGGLWLWVFAVGTVMNAAVIFANGGAMPVAGELLARLSPALAQSLAGGGVFGYTLGTGATPLAFLGDVLCLGGGRVSLGFASVGDIFIGAGGGLLVFRLLRTPAPAETSSRRVWRKGGASR